MNVQMVNEVVAQAEGVSHWKPKKKNHQRSRKETPPIVSAKPLLPLHFLLGLRDKAVGGAGAGVAARWMVFLCFSICSFRSCITEGMCNGVLYSSVCCQISLKERQ